jgi:hypothetical protein
MAASIRGLRRTCCVAKSIKGIMRPLNCPEGVRRRR